jgi:hypothetical protein
MQRKYKKEAQPAPSTQKSLLDEIQRAICMDHTDGSFFSSKVGQVAGPKGNIHLGSLAMYLPLLSPTSPDPLSLFSFIETRQNSRIPPHYYDDDDRAAARGEFTFLFLFN